MWVFFFFANRQYFKNLYPRKLVPLRYLNYFRLHNLIDGLTTAVKNLSKKNVEYVDKTKLGNLLNIISSTFIEEHIKSDGLQISSLHKSTSYLSNLNSTRFLLERNQLLLEFINGAIKFDYKSQDNSVLLYSLAMTVEMIYYLRNNNLILPHCFMANLVQSFIAGSKTVSVINGKVSPSASYTSYKNWMANKGSKPLPSPINDSITFFDNIGKYIAKSCRVSSEKNPSADIITATLHFTLDNSQLQQNEALMPGKWRGKNPTDLVQSKMMERINIANATFRKYRLHFIENVLDMVSKENDDVEQKILSRQASARMCTNEVCGKTFDVL